MDHPLTHHRRATPQKSNRPRWFSFSAIHPRLMIWATGTIAILVAITLPQAAWANSWPPMAVSLFNLPLFASFISFGWGLVAIIAIEAITILKRETYSSKRVWIAVTGANLVSSITGLIFSFGLVVIPFLNYGDDWNRRITFVLIGCLGLMGLTTHDALRQLTPWSVGWRWLWLLFWPFNLVLALVIIGIINAKFPFWIELFCAFAYFMIGWAMSWAIEGACLAKWLPNPSVHLGRSIAIANLRSYAYVVIPLVIGLYLQTRAFFN